MPDQGVGDAADQAGMAELQGRKVDRDAPVAIALLRPHAHLPAGFVQHPVADGDDQAGLFCQHDELVRQQQAQLRMLPAQQRLGAHRLAVAGVEFGLVMQAQLPPFLGHAQLLQQLQLLARIGVHRPIEEAVAVLAGTLGVVHRGIGVHQQFVLVGTIAREHGDTDTGGNLQALLAHPEWPRDEIDLVGSDAWRIIGFRQLHQQHELIAAYARQRVLAMEIGAQAQAHFAQQLVAHMVAEGIVDRLEAIQVNKHQGETATAFGNLVHGLVDTVGQQYPVGQSGQGVMQGQLGQFLVGQGQGVGKLGGACFQACVQHRGQQGDGQYRQAGDQHQVIQAMATEAGQCGATETALGKVGSGHAGVVHADDGDAHHDRGTTAYQAHMGRLPTQLEGNPQGGG
ncbi:hypothetical protein D9M71_130850 [compost metagenome]